MIAGYHQLPASVSKDGHTVGHAEGLDLIYRCQNRYIRRFTEQLIRIKSIIACFYRMRLPPVLRSPWKWCGKRFIGIRVNHLLGISLMTLLVGCASQPTASIPIPQACIAQLPAKPIIRTDSELSALDDFQIVLAIREDELTLLNYSEQLEAVATPCTK